MNVNLLNIFFLFLKNKYWISILLLLALVNCWLYNPFHLYFLNDDFLHLYLTDKNILFQQRSIRPVHEILMKLELLVYQKNAYGYHITALALHFIVCVEVFFLARVILTKIFLVEKQQATQTSFLSVVIFLLYPQYTEALAWLIGRGTILSTVFIIPVVLLFFKEEKNALTFLAAFLLYLVALLSYEQIVLFTLILFSWCFFEKNKAIQKQQFIFCAVILLATIIYLIARKITTTEIIGNYEADNYLNFNLIVLLQNGFKFFNRLFLNPLQNKIAFLITSLVFTILVVFFMVRNKTMLFTKPIASLIAAIIALVLPVLSLSVSTQSYESGRFLYLPSIFLVILLAYFFQYFFQKKISIILFCIISCYWFVAKVQSSNYYHEASVYAKKVQQKITNDYKQNPTNTIVIDTLYPCLQNLPVYRTGLKEGALWLNENIDTQKIRVNFYMEDKAKMP